MAQGDLRLKGQKKLSTYKRRPDRWSVVECEICGRTQGSQALARDHDHRTGVPRGRLCVSCNVGLGSLQDSVTVLKRAIRYIEMYRVGIQDELLQSEYARQMAAVAGEALLNRKAV